MDRNLDSRGRISEPVLQTTSSEEAVAHVIMYGAARMIHGDCSRAGRDTEDTARPFDPTQLPPPALPTSLAALEDSCIMNVETAAIG